MAMLDITFLPKSTVSDKSQCRHPNTKNIILTQSPFLDLVHHLKFLRHFTSQRFESWLCFCLQVGCS